MKRKQSGDGHEPPRSKIRTERTPKEQKIMWAASSPLNDDKPTSLEKLLHIAWKSKGIPSGNGSINWMKLWLLVPTLTELKNMVGMEELKTGVIDFVVCALQGLTIGIEKLHTILSGPPGSGKTEVARILAKIYHRLGFVATDKFMIVRRDDLTGFGSEKELSAQLDQAKGGVLFIDGSKSVSGIEKGIDSFVSVMDLLNRRVSLSAKNIPENPVCIVSGNEGEMEKYLFFVQSGVKSIFSWHFSISKYTPKQMVSIFEIKAKREGWVVDKDALREGLFIKNHDLFQAYGRDISSLFDMCLIAHSSRLFGNRTPSKIITKEDCHDGLEKYKRMKRKDVTNIQTYFG